MGCWWVLLCELDGRVLGVSSLGCWWRRRFARLTAGCWHAVWGAGGCCFGARGHPAWAAGGGAALRDWRPGARGMQFGRPGADGM